MDVFLQLPPADRRLAFEQVKAMTGLQAMESGVRPAPGLRT